MTIPMLRAVPSTIRIAASTFAAFKSGIFDSAISRTLSRLTVATLLRLGSPEPDSIPAAFLRVFLIIYNGPCRRQEQKNEMLEISF